MRKFSLQNRPGVTLIELLLFLVIFSVVVTVTLPLLFRSTENRLLQQNIALVEQNGLQVMQTLALHVQHAESILHPAQGQEAKWLALKTNNEFTNPTIIGIRDNTLDSTTNKRFALIQGIGLEHVTSDQVDISNLVVRNTSDTNGKSVHVTFTITRNTPLVQPRGYIKHFEGTFSLFPDQSVATYSCTPPAPTPQCAACDATCTGYRVTYQICDTEVLGRVLEPKTQLDCQ